MDDPTFFSSGKRGFVRVRVEQWITGGQMERQAERAPLRYRDARKLAGQICGYADLSGMSMSRRGAFFFHNARHGAMALVDEACLDAPAREAIAPHEGEIAGVCQLPVRAFLGPKGEIESFLSPRDTALRKDGVQRPFCAFNVWQFDWEAWCLPHIFAGIVAGSHGDKEALRHFDENFARSNHDRMQARQALAERARSRGLRAAG